MTYLSPIDFGFVRLPGLWGLSAPSKQGERDGLTVFFFFFKSLDFWEYYLPYLYSCISFLGVLLLLGECPEPGRGWGRSRGQSTPSRGWNEGAGRAGGREKALAGDCLLSPQCVLHWVSPACSRSLGSCWSSPGYVVLLVLGPCRGSFLKSWGPSVKPLSICSVHTLQRATAFAGSCILDP